MLTFEEWSWVASLLILMQKIAGQKRGERPNPIPGAKSDYFSDVIVWEQKTEE